MAEAVLERPRLAEQETAARPEKKPKTVQMNIRIDPELKEAGTAALERAGYSPSAAVRRLWEYAAQHGGDPIAVRRYLDSEDSFESDVAEENLERFNAFEEGRKQIADQYSRIVSSPSGSWANRPWKELRDEMYDRWLQEEGA